MVKIPKKYYVVKPIFFFTLTFFLKVKLNFLSYTQTTLPETNWHSQEYHCTLPVHLRALPVLLRTLPVSNENKKRFPELFQALPGPIGKLPVPSGHFIILAKKMHKVCIYSFQNPNLHSPYPSKLSEPFQNSQSPFKTLRAPFKTLRALSKLSEPLLKLSEPFQNSQSPFQTLRALSNSQSPFQNSQSPIKNPNF